MGLMFIKVELYNGVFFWHLHLSKWTLKEIKFLRSEDFSILECFFKVSIEPFRWRNRVNVEWEKLLVNKTKKKERILLIGSTTGKGKPRKMDCSMK